MKVRRTNARNHSRIHAAGRAGDSGPKRFAFSYGVSLSSQLGVSPTRDEWTMSAELVTEATQRYIEPKVRFLRAARLIVAAVCQSGGAGEVFD